MTSITKRFRLLTGMVFDERDGPLPAFLMALTIVTGMVDALSFLRLGEVFVANMTGNIVLLGFAVAGSPGFSGVAHIAALAAFVVGAMAGGRLGAAFGAHRGRLMAVIASAKIVLGGSAVVILLYAPRAEETPFQYALIIILAISMGLQNAGVRKLGIPDLTTTVLTGTITALSADLAVGGGVTSQLVRRILSAILLFVGAGAGALLLKVAGIAAVLLVNLCLLTCIAIGAFRLWSSRARWTAQ